MAAGPPVIHRARDFHELGIRQVQITLTKVGHIHAFLAGLDDSR